MAGAARTTDVAVVGAGIVGLSTAYALAERGADFVVFEAARPGAGQSAGRTRIFRHVHRTPELVRLAAEARAVWEEWEARLGTALLGDQGAMLIGRHAPELLPLLSEAGLPARLLDAAEQEALLPILNAPGAPALLDERGGPTDVAAAIAALAGAVAERLVPAQVFRVDPGEPAVLETSEGIWRARRVVLCAGASIGELAPAAGLDIPVSVRCHARVTFGLRDRSWEGRLPCLQEQSGAFGEMVYGSPVPGAAQYAVGLVGESSEVDLGPGREAGVESLVARIVAYAEQALPGLDPAPAELRLCLSSSLPGRDDNFRVWSSGSVHALAGDNLFKFGPLLGRRLAGAAFGEGLGGLPAG